MIDKGEQNMFFQPYGLRMIAMIMVVVILSALFVLFPEPPLQRPTQSFPVSMPLATADLSTPVSASGLPETILTPLPQEFTAMEWHEGGNNSLHLYNEYRLVVRSPDYEEFKIRDLGFVDQAGSEASINRFEISYRGMSRTYDLVSGEIFGIGISGKGWITIPEPGWSYRYEKVSS